MGTIETPQLEEMISEDGILCLILSSLSLKEAVAASILSRRWRHLSTHLPKLIFDAANILDDRVAGQLGDILLPANIKYKLELACTIPFIKSVNSILQQQQGRAGLEEFCVHYSLQKVHSHHIDEWVRFAVAAKTKILTLYLYHMHSRIEVEFYDFPYQLLGLSSSLEQLSLSGCSLKSAHGFQSLNRLTELYLFWVDITEEDLNSLLANVCSTLKKMCFWMCGPWTTLSISCPLSQLQKLIVVDCGQFRKIEINAVKLWKMRYQGVPVDFIFRQTTQLEYAEIHFDKKGNVDNLDSCITKLPRNLPHIQTLIFQISNFSQVSVLPKGSNTFIRLTHLDWAWNVGVKMSLLHLASLLNASPVLEELKLRLSTRTVEPPPQKLEELKKNLPTHPHSHLKTVEICDFYCDKWQIELALYLLNNAIELELMTIEKGCKLLMGIHEMAMQSLSQQVPEKTKLIIL